MNGDGGLILRVLIKKIIRDIKEIKLQFLALIVILSLGAGMFYGMNMMTIWREDSLDYAYENLQWEDLQIDLYPNSFVNSTLIMNELYNTEISSNFESLEFRLVLTTAINVSKGESFTIIPAKVIGINVTFTRPISGTNIPDVNKINIELGRYFKTDETNSLSTIADKRLFKHHSLSLGDEILLLTSSGSVKVELIGSATFPDYLVLIDESSMGLFSEKQYTVLQIPLKAFQELFMLENQINQVIVRVKDNAMINDIKDSLEESLSNLGISSIISLGSDHPVYSMQYEDLQNDNQLFQMITLLFLVGGLFGTYITINRLTASQRREIGVSLALGFNSRNIINQYLLFGLLVSFLSAILTFILGAIFANVFWKMVKDMLGLPFYIVTQDPTYYIVACLIIFFLPFITVLLTVAKMSRLLPVELIRFDPGTTHSTSSKTILEKTLLRFFNSSIATKISLRNLFRNKRRTASTSLGVLMSIILMGAMWGLINTFDSGIQTAEENIGTWDLKLESKELAPASVWNDNLNSNPSNKSIRSFILTFQTVIRFPGHFEHDGSDYYRLLEGIPNIGSIRSLNLIEGSFSQQGLVISKKTAIDLDKQVGDSIILEHMTIGGSFGVQLKNSTMKITGIHDQIFSSYSFIPLETIQSICNASNLVNAGYVVLNENSIEQAVTQDLYLTIYNINRITSREALIEETKTIFDMFYEIMIVAQGLCMVLALGLIYSSIFSNIHERKREIGTLRTLGTSSKTIIRYIFLENTIMVSIGLILGYFLGYQLIDLILQEILTETFPHLYVPTILTLESWMIIITSIFFILIIAHISVMSFLRNLDLVAATKVRE